jgi:ribosomal protein S18 acetylase RimI-like enzyme
VNTKKNLKKNSIKGKNEMEIKITKAEIPDAEQILTLQKLCYQSEAKLYNDYNIPPLKQTIDQMIDDINNMNVLKMSFNNQIIGSIRALIKNNSCLIGRVIVHPEYQNRWLGKKLMHEIEGLFKNQVNRYELFTGDKSLKNIKFYETLGYKIYKSEILINNVTIVYMEKFI